MIQHWESIELAKEASSKMVKSSETLEFRNVLDPKTVKLRFLTLTQTWSKS